MNVERNPDNLRLQSNPDQRNYSFGKAFVLQSQKQGSANSQGQYETNKLFGKETSDLQQTEDLMVDSTPMHSAHERESSSSKELAIHSGQIFHTKEMLNSTRPMRLSSFHKNGLTDSSNQDKVVSPRSQRTKVMVNSFQQQNSKLDDGKLKQGLLMEQIRKQSNSQINSLSKTTPKEGDSGLKNSVFNFFKFDTLFGRSQERMNQKVPLTQNNNLMAQQIKSTKQINQKLNYQSNLMEELSVDNERLNESLPFTEPVSSIATAKLSRQDSSYQRGSKHHAKGVSFLQHYSKGSNFNIENQKSKTTQGEYSPQSKQEKQQLIKIGKFSEITSINMVNPINQQHKTIFRIKKGPSMQIEFKNKQAKKEIHQDTVIDRSSSGESCPNLGLTLGTKGTPSKPMSNQLLSQRKIFTRGSRTSNISNNIHQLSYRSKQKLQQIDKIQNIDSDPDSGPINMTSEDEEDNDNEKEQSNPALNTNNVQMYSEYSAGAGITPVQRKEELQGKDELQREYERLQKELLRLKELSSMPTSPSRQFPMRNAPFAPTLVVGKSTKNLLFAEGQKDAERLKRSRQQHNRSQMPVNYGGLQIDNKLKESIGNEHPSRIRSKSKIAEIQNNRITNKSIELDVESQMELKTYAGSKVVEDPDILYQFDQRQHTQREKPLTSDVLMRSILEQGKKKKKDPKINLQREPRESVKPKQHILIYKKSFLSDQENNRSETDQYSQENDSYSASMSSNQPSTLEDQHHSQTIDKRTKYSSKKARHHRNHNTSNMHEHYNKGKAQSSKRSISTQSIQMRSQSKVYKQPKVLNNTNYPSTNSLVGDALSPTSQKTNELINQKVMQEQYQIQISNLQNQIIQMQNRSIMHQQNQSNMINSSFMNQSVFSGGLMLPQNQLNQSTMMYPSAGSQFMNMSIVQPGQNQTTISQNAAAVQNQYQETIKLLKTQLENQQQQIQNMQEDNVNIQEYNQIDNRSNQNSALSRKTSGVSQKNEINNTSTTREIIEQNEYNIEDTLNLKSSSKQEDDIEDPCYKQEIANLIKNQDLTLQLVNKEEIQGDEIQIEEGNSRDEDEEEEEKQEEVKSSSSMGYKLIDNQYKNTLVKIDGKKMRGTIKNSLKQTAGFPSMLDSGIQGINNPPVIKNIDTDLPGQAYHEYDEFKGEGDYLSMKMIKVNDNDYEPITYPELQHQNTMNQHQGYSGVRSYQEIELDYEEDKTQTPKNEEYNLKTQLLIIGFDDKPKGKMPLKLKHSDLLRQSPMFKDNMLSPHIIKGRDRSSKFKGPLTGGKYQSSHLLENKNMNQQITIKNHRTTSRMIDADENINEANNSGIIWPVSNKEVQTKQNSEARSELNKANWPTKKESVDVTNKDYTKDKSHLLIVDDLPNLQEIFMKNKYSISVSNRREQRLKDASTLLGSNKTVQVLDNHGQSHTLRVNKSPSPKEINKPLESSENGDIESQQHSVQLKRCKTKEELAELRKQMMKKKFNLNVNSHEVRSEVSKVEASNNDIRIIQQLSTTPKQLKHLPNHKTPIRPYDTRKRDKSTASQLKQLPAEDNLLSRLASGQKIPIDRKAMKRLTNKNYEKLPEIRKKKEDAILAEELLAKKERALKYKKELQTRLKTNMLKKQLREKEKKQTTKEIKTTETIETVIISKQGSGKIPASIQIIQKNKKQTNTKESYV